MIYAIRAVGTEFVKIGFTTSYFSTKRMRELQIGCPHDLEVLAFADGTEMDERVLHGMLKESGLHVRGEWFRMGDKTERLIKMLMATPAPIPLTAKKARNPHRRLGAALSVEYREPTSHDPNSTASAPRTTQALQPNKGAA